jgi:DNA modification methylase
MRGCASAAKATPTLSLAQGNCAYAVDRSAIDEATIVAVKGRRTLKRVGRYRSQYELLPLFKKSSAPHVNNVELGKRGRWRSNVWTYPGASPLGSEARRGLKRAPDSQTAICSRARFSTSPIAATSSSTFLGSGSTLIAADKTAHVCPSVELDPLYVDVIVRRYEAATGAPARPSRRWRPAGCWKKRRSEIRTRLA